ncbi:nuclear transport factor 2 family protein [Phenylobacterium montanum]|uniref:Nuclear transport factor 2 family protein n=1 Tax=Phenylobacterium montanum TaxID=2823693 RepID=A0A975G3D5_9CAUL|nr:nuclear transport factor 2 family protein [Caulobacter sp. S6]QUD90395.1 nuclear transport factor 2 family protein [Caulobacter sp. S6]
MSLERIVLELKARTEILETMYAYCRHADNLDPEGMVALFTEDCIANFVPGGEETILKGKGALRKMLSDALGVTVSGSHHISNAELIFDGPERATLHCYMYSWQRFTGFPVTADCHRWGRYENRFLLTPTGWRMDRLKLISAGEYGGARIGEQLGRPFPPQFP